MSMGRRTLSRPAEARAQKLALRIERQLADMMALTRANADTAATLQNREICRGLQRTLNELKRRLMRDAGAGQSRWAAASFGLAGAPAHPIRQAD